MYMKFQQYINESSLSRIWKHNEKYDCGAMTAFRDKEDCGDGKKYTKKENLQRNKSLLAKLMSKGYVCTRLRGKYPEGGDVGKETSFFIVDIKDNGKLEQNLKKLGEEFEQDSVLFIPKGSIQNKNKAYLIGTNKCSNNWLGYDQTKIFNKGKVGYESEIYTSYVNGRPFIFESVDESSINIPGNGFGWASLQIVANKKWCEI